MKPLFVLVVCAACIFGHSQTKDEPPKVVGGESVNIEDYPYTIQLYYDGYWFICGGSIIAPNWIISAAHCTYEKDDALFSIRAGTSIFHGTDGEDVKVKNIYNHPKFDPDSLNNDLCVIELVKPLSFGSTINKISLPEPYEEVPVGSTGVVSGWGRLSHDGPHPDRLQAAEVPIIDTVKCEELYPNAITSSMFCAGPIEGGVGVCHGDSGGPLVVDGVLVGVASWVRRGERKCADSPGVFAKVSLFTIRDFITEITGL